MGCFFACFRVKEDDDRAQPPRSIRYRKPPHSTQEAVVSRNPLQALFLSDGNEDSPSKDGESLVYGSPHFSKELRDEGKFLKACGTLQETPNEIRKASNWPMASPTEGRDSENSKFHSWLPVSSIERLQLELNKRYELSPTPLRLSNKYGEGSNSAEHTASSCILDNQNTGTSSISSSEGSQAFKVKTTIESHERQNAQCRNKSVRFECDVDGSSSRDSTSEMANRSFEESESPRIQNTSNAGPHPTPMKLTEEMQTPGTVFPSYMEILSPQRARIRSEYVHSVLNPVQSVSQWKSLMDGKSNCNLLLDELDDNSEQPGSTREESEMHIEETSARKESKVETSLSSWLKPPQNKGDDDDHQFRAVASRKSQVYSTPGDRPIIGLVAAHWNENETQTLPKWWDGNGIPNSTNKYKEDQKVSWHATPFEERLEKALSEESSISQRNQPQGMPITFERDEESDTALSHFRNSAHSESVVSF